MCVCVCVCVCVLGAGARGEHGALLGGYCSNLVVLDHSDSLEKMRSGQFWVNLQGESGQDWWIRITGFLKIEV